jgi:hypothetical protein
MEEKTLEERYIPLYLGWMCDDKKMALEDRISDGALRYRDKFGHNARIVIMCHTEWEEAGKPSRVGGLDARTADYVRPNHYWIGTGRAKA